MGAIFVLFCASSLAMLTSNGQDVDPQGCLDCHDVEECRDLNSTELLDDLADESDQTFSCRFGNFSRL